MWWMWWFFPFFSTRERYRKKTGNGVRIHHLKDLNHHTSFLNPWRRLHSGLQIHHHTSYLDALIEGSTPILALGKSVANSATEALSGHDFFVAEALLLRPGNVALVQL